jgi:hypothetical protein
MQIINHWYSLTGRTLQSTLASSHGTAATPDTNEFGAPCVRMTLQNGSGLPAWSVLLLPAEIELAARCLRDLRQGSPK